MQSLTRINDPGRRPELLDHAIDIWRKAQILHDRRSCQGEPKSTAIAEEIAESHPELEAPLASLLLDPSQLVAAHALWTLELMRSPLLENLPPEVLQNRSRVTLITGSLKTSTDLGSLARQAQRRARARAGVTPASPTPEAEGIGIPAER